MVERTRSMMHGEKPPSIFNDFPKKGVVQTLREHPLFTIALFMALTILSCFFVVEYLRNNTDYFERRGRNQRSYNDYSRDRNLTFAEQITAEEFDA